MNIRKLFGNVLDWIYPPVCIHCGKPGALICEDCLSELPTVGEHYCSHCGKPLQPGHPCRLCGVSEFRFQASRAPYLYEGPAAAMIKKLKFGGALDLVPVMSEELAEFWKTLNWEADLIVPVPLSRKRQAERGFNQSEMIARSFAKAVGIPCDPGALMKIRDTLQQVGLNADKRRGNLQGAFKAEPVLVSGKRLLLVDDVMTTGSTFAECSAALLDAGAKSVKCLSVATTPINHGNKNMTNA